MDVRGELLGVGDEGEIVIRGENVTSGYLGNAAALVGSVRELGVLTGIATPTIDMIHALIEQRAAFRQVP